MLPTSPAEVAAAQEAGRKATIEIWTLFAIGFTTTMLRIYARIHAVGVRNLRPDDFLVLVALVSHGTGRRLFCVAVVVVVVFLFAWWTME